jgi:O-antigen/teichoic acid export membrane protein
MAAAEFTGSPLWVGVATLGGALASVSFFAMIAWRRFSSFGLPPRLWNREEFQGLLRPALSQMSVPICWAISNQVLTQVVLATLGPLITVIYTTHRTIGNLVLQAVNPINQVVIPEYSREYGRRNLDAITRVYRYSCLGSTIIASVGLAIAMGVGPAILPIWTRQTVSFDLLLFSLIGISALLRALWLTGSMYGYAINRFGAFAIAWLLSSALTLLAVGACVEKYGIHGVAFGSVVGECMMVLFVLPYSNRLMRRMSG